MTLPITDFSLYLAENGTFSDVPAGIVILISAVIFIAATALGGIISYKVKLKNLQKNSPENKSSESDKEVK